MKKQVNALIKTVMLRRYLFYFAFRVGVFCAVFWCYVGHRALLRQIMLRPLTAGITPLHLLWLVFMITMLLHLFPAEWLSMAARKTREHQYVEEPDYDRLALYEFVQEQNICAWKVMLCWITLNGIVGALYLLRILTEVDLLMLSVFYYLCDYICILFYCPFQHLIMKNRCCINCRIYDWGHFMMFTPMLFIRNVYSWSLFFMSCVVLIHWELVYARHPERFWHGANRRLQCQYCQDRTCQMKKKWMGKETECEEDRQ